MKTLEILLGIASVFISAKVYAFTGSKPIPIPSPIQVSCPTTEHLKTATWTEHPTDPTEYPMYYTTGGMPEGPLYSFRNRWWHAFVVGFRPPSHYTVGAPTITVKQDSERPDVYSIICEYPITGAPPQHMIKATLPYKAANYSCKKPTPGSDRVICTSMRT